MEFMELLEMITMAVTLIMFSTGIFPIMNMYQTRETRNVPFHMFLLGAIGCLGMFHYGLMLDNKTLIFLNGIGSLLQSSYVIVYLIISPVKGRALQYLTMGIIYWLMLYSYLYMGITKVSVRQDTLGMMSSLITTMLMCLPAVEVVGNIRHKNADGMPRVMLLGGLACSSCWLWYGYLLDDPNVYAPNIPGIVITVAKLYVISLYSKPIKAKVS